MSNLILRYIEVAQEYIEDLERQIEDLTKQNDFLMKRENKLQIIEQQNELASKCSYYEKLLKQHNISFLK